VTEQTQALRLVAKAAPCIFVAAGLLGLLGYAMSPRQEEVSARVRYDLVDAKTAQPRYPWCSCPIPYKPPIELRHYVSSVLFCERCPRPMTATSLFSSCACVQWLRDNAPRGTPGCSGAGWLKREGGSWVFWWGEALVDWGVYPW